MQERKIPPYVQDWMHEIANHVRSNNACVLEFCTKLEQYAEETNDDYLKGYSLFYRGFYQYFNAQLEQGMALFSCALNYLIAAQEWDLVSRTYNLMGNIADFHGDISLAIDCYMKGLSLAVEYDIPKMEYNIRINIANVYISLSSFENARTMLLRSDHLLENGLVMSLDARLAARANLINCYLQLGLYDEASQQLQFLRQRREDVPSTTNILLCSVFETQLYHATGNTEARDEAIATLRNLDLHSMDVYNAINELCFHAKLLLEMERFDDFLALVNRLEQQADNPNIEKRVLDLQMKYYQKIADYDRLAEKALQYYEVAERREVERNKIISHNIITRMHLDEEAQKRQEVERSNRLLQQKLEHDALTGMTNRYKFNEIAELAFHKAQLNGTPLTVGVLDIDCYKEFNDNYGHQAGDDCLVHVAQAIRSLEEYGGVHTARYGGDEFVIIYEEHSQKEVEKMAQHLQDLIHNLNIEHKYSTVCDRVSISHGLFHHIPSNDDKLWDFLYCADMVLYGVKHRGKNHFHLDTSFEVVSHYNDTTQR